MIPRAVFALAELALPAGAQAAPTVKFDRTCYTPGETITETGTGFTPNTPVAESLTWFVDSRLVSGPFPLQPIVTDGRGAFTSTEKVHSPKRDSDVQEQVVSTFTDSALGSAALPVEVRWTLSRWVMSVPEWGDGVANPGRSMRVLTLGWTTLRGSLWAHYYRGTTRVRSIRVAPITGDCGNVVTRVVQFPFVGPKKGEWKVFFSNTRVLDKRNDAYFFYNVTVR